jgi:hypothetical protein
VRGKGMAKKAKKKAGIKNNAKKKKAKKMRIRNT